MVEHGRHSDSAPFVVEVEGLNFYYGKTQALKNVTISIRRQRVTALIGPSGCGKSTFLRSLNRLNDRLPGARVEGKIRIDGQDPYAKRVDRMKLRRKVAMVFQKPNPFPMSIYDNVALGPRVHFGLKGRELDEVVEESLARAALLEEVKDDMRRKSGLDLSGGQQQRLCIARMLAVQPEILLMDEPCSALDPISTFKIEELIVDLAERHTVITVTHNMQQASRISYYTAFFMLGEMVEYDATPEIFQRPKEKSTEDYVTGRFG